MDLKKELIKQYVIQSVGLSMINERCYLQLAYALHNRFALPSPRDPCDPASGRSRWVGKRVQGHRFTAFDLSRMLRMPMTTIKAIGLV
jgi:hypothetical protein